MKKKIFIHSSSPTLTGIHNFSPTLLGIHNSSPTLIGIPCFSIISLHPCYLNVRYFSIAPLLRSSAIADQNEHFLSTIPSIYISSKNKPIFVYFNLNELNFIHFTSKISSTVPKNFVYTVFIKVRYSLDSFFMAGSQFGFDFSSNSEIQNLFNVVMSRLEGYFDAYNLSEDDVIYIQISFTQIDKKLLIHLSLLPLY